MSDVANDSFDPKRRLCADGACTGIIGRNGRCSVCGARDDGRPEPGLGPEAFASGCVDEDDDAAIEPVLAGPSDDAADFNAKRPLCSDGACVGVLGQDGRCRTCGLRGDAVPAP